MKIFEKLKHKRTWIKPVIRTIFIMICIAGVAVVAFATSLKTEYLIKDGDKIYSISSYTNKIENVLEECGIDAKNVSFTVNESDDVTEVTVIYPITVSVTYNGVTSFVAMDGGTVRDALRQLNILVSKYDKISQPLDAQIYDGMKIGVTKVEVTYVTTDSPIEFTSTYVENKDLEEGKSYILTEGQEGTVRQTYKRVETDGVLSAYELYSEETITEPVEQVVEYGTKSLKTTAVSSTSNSSSSSQSNTSSSGSTNSKTETSSSAVSSSTGGTVTTSSGETYNYTKTLNMVATAYTYEGNELDITSSGVPVQVGVVAAAKNVLPQGTKVYITSAYGTWEYGYAVVGDTGVTGNVIDLFMETYDECIQFGVRDAVVYILE